MSDHIGFLTLPLELRQIIYHSLLCTWSPNHKRDRIHLATHPHPNPTAILVTNRQIHQEANDYLLKRNQFIRIDCDGLSIRSDPLGRQILPVTEDARKIAQFRGYVARIRWSTNSDGDGDGLLHGERERRPVKRKVKMYMVLGRQFGDVLRCADYHVMTRWPAITMEIVMEGVGADGAGAEGSFASELRPFQVALLEAIPGVLRAFQGLVIRGRIVPVELAERIVNEVALPR